MKKSSPHKQILTNRLWRYRKTHQLSQKDVALLLGHKKTTQVSRWENGEKHPTLENAFSLGHILKVPVETLFPELAAERQKQVEARAPKVLPPPSQPPHA